VEYRRQLVSQHGV